MSGPAVGPAVVDRRGSHLVVEDARRREEGAEAHLAEERLHAGQRHERPRGDLPELAGGERGGGRRRTVEEGPRGRAGTTAAARRPPRAGPGAAARGHARRARAGATPAAGAGDDDDDDDDDDVREARWRGPKRAPRPSERAAVAAIAGTRGSGAGWGSERDDESARAWKTSARADAGDASNGAANPSTPREKRVPSRSCSDARRPGFHFFDRPRSTRDRRVRPDPVRSDASDQFPRTGRSGPVPLCRGATWPAPERSRPLLVSFLASHSAPRAVRSPPSPPPAPSMRAVGAATGLALAAPRRLARPASRAATPPRADPDRRHRRPARPTRTQLCGRRGAWTIASARMPRMPVACRAAAVGGPEPGTPGKPGPGRTAASDAPATTVPPPPSSSSSSSSSIDRPVVGSADPDQSAVGCLFDRLPLGAFLARLLGPLVAKLLRTWLWSRRVHAPIRVTLGDAPGNDALLAACPRFDTAVSSYDAVEVLANRHASTIVASVFRADAKVEYQREVLRMRDGGHVTLDWPIRVPNEGGEETRGFPVKPTTSEGGSFRTGSGDEGETLERVDGFDGEKGSASSSSSSASSASSSSASSASSSSASSASKRGSRRRSRSCSTAPPGSHLRTDFEPIRTPTRARRTPAAVLPPPPRLLASTTASRGSSASPAAAARTGAARAASGAPIRSKSVRTAVLLRTDNAAAQNHLPPGPPYRRSIPDQGVHATRAFLSTHWRLLPDDAPVLVLMSGIAGGSHDKYLKHFLVGAARRGYRCVAFNCRGTSDSPLTTPQFYSASFTGDARAVVDELAGRWPDADVFVGWSLGANILTNFLGEEGPNAKVAGAVAMCNPIRFEQVRRGLAERVLRDAIQPIDGGEHAQTVRAARAPVRGVARVRSRVGGESENRPRLRRGGDEGDVRVPLGGRVLRRVEQRRDDRAGQGAAVGRAGGGRPDRGAGRDAEGRPSGRARGERHLGRDASGGHLGWTAGEEAPFGAPWPDRGAFEFLDAVRGRGNTARRARRGRRGTRRR